MTNHRYLFILLLTLTACSTAPEYAADSGTLPACGGFPNCVNSESGTGSQAIAPLPAGPDQWLALKEWIAEQDDWATVTDRGDFLQCVVTTPLMRYRDDVQLLHKPESGLIHVRSSSRLGIGDMGANRDRVELLRSQLASGK